MTGAALKALVIIMTLMILAGFTLLGAIVVGRLARRPAATPPAGAFVAPAIALPSGARIETMSLGGERLVVGVVLPDGNRELLVIDVATGRRLATVPLRTAP